MNFPSQASTFTGEIINFQHYVACIHCKAKVDEATGTCTSCDAMLQLCWCPASFTAQLVLVESTADPNLITFQFFTEYILDLLSMPLPDLIQMSDNDIKHRIANLTAVVTREHYNNKVAPIAQDYTLNLTSNRPRLYSESYLQRPRLYSESYLQ